MEYPMVVCPNVDLMIQPCPMRHQPYACAEHCPVCHAERNAAKFAAERNS